MKRIKRDFRSKACVSPRGLTKEVGSKGQNSNFSAHGHVAYQIKENHECSNMVANILHANPPFVPPPPPRTLGMGSIGKNSLFSEHGHVAYQIKGNHEMQQHGSKHFARRPPPPPTHTHDPGEGSIGQNSEYGHVTYQIKGNHEMQQHGSNIFARRPSPTTLGDESKVKI